MKRYFDALETLEAETLFFENGWKLYNCFLDKKIQFDALNLSYDWQVAKCKKEGNKKVFQVLTCQLRVADFRNSCEDLRLKAEDEFAAWNPAVAPDHSGCYWKQL